MFVLISSVLKNESNVVGALAKQLAVEETLLKPAVNKIVLNWFTLQVEK